MPLTIAQPVGLVTAVIFFVIDIPAAWMIHRGLLALQSYHLYKRAKNGHIVSIVRSRIPIVSGELLRGSSKLPSLFIIANCSVFVCIFFAMFDVSAGKQPKWSMGSYKNITSLAMPNDVTDMALWNGTISFAHSNYQNLTCRTHNETHAVYWPCALNAKQNEKETEALNVSCQAGAPEVSPMLTTSCVALLGERGCLIKTFAGIQLTRLEIEGPTKELHRGVCCNLGANHILVEEYSFSGEHLSFVKDPIMERGIFQQDLVGSQGHAFVFRKHIPSGGKLSPMLDGFSNRSAIFFFYNSTINSWFFAPAAEVVKDESAEVVGYLEFEMFQALRVTPHVSTSIEYLLLSCRKNRKLAMFIMASLRSRSVEFGDLSAASMFFEAILRRMVRAVPKPPPMRTYFASLIPVTILSNVSVVLYATLIGFAVLLLPIRRLLFHFHVYRGEVPESQLFFSEFDQMSKTIRFLREELQRQRHTGEYATLHVEDPFRTCARRGTSIEFSATQKYPPTFLGHSYI